MQQPLLQGCVSGSQASPPVFSDSQVLDKGLDQVLVLEDDVRFEPRFKRRLQTIMEDVIKARLDWDLM